MIFLLVVLPTILTLAVVSTNFSPNLDANFLFLYVGITSAVATAVWSTFTLAETPARKRYLFNPTILVLIAAIAALLAAVLPQSTSRDLLDASVSFLLVALFWMVLHSFIEIREAEKALAALASASTIPPAGATGAAPAVGPPGPTQSNPPPPA